MTAPGWLAPGTAALMLLIAASCAARLAISTARGRRTETDADGLHVLMGIAMAGMLQPRLSFVPGTVWEGVFGVAAAWFGWWAVRSGINPRTSTRPGGWRCAHPAPHAVECAAMVYMLVPGGSPTHSPVMTMPGASGVAAGSNPAIALVLALFMLGYVLWTTDRLAGRARTSAPGVAAADAGTLLAPRFAACYKIAMSMAMGYMLVMTL
jgi:Domain of unknown function (DUF5134)